MGTAVRHLIGGVYGVVLIPLLSFLLGNGMFWFSQVMRTFEFRPGPIIGGAALILACGVLVALAHAPFMSPLAGLLCGVVYLAYGVFTLVGQFLVPGVLPYLGFDVLWSYYGSQMYLLLGPVLLLTAVWPSRWRSRPAAPARPVPAMPPPAPMPAPGPEKTP